MYRVLNGRYSFRRHVFNGRINSRLSILDKVEF
jgi:hypothetical protein